MRTPDTLRIHCLVCVSLVALLVMLVGCDTECREGYVDRDGVCVDIDECTATNPPDRHECGATGVCTNTPGGYSCFFPHPKPE